MTISYNMERTTYQNRYGDLIVFKHISESEIEMTGYTSEWMRCGYPNDYTEAYQVYLNQCNALTEPDYFYLIEDDNENKLRPMTFQEFAHRVETDDKYREYLRYAVSDQSRIDMVDPSGGPYIALGTNLGRYFMDGKRRIVEEIFVNKDSVTFKIEE